MDLLDEYIRQCGGIGHTLRAKALDLKIFQAWMFEKALVVSDLNTRYIQQFVETRSQIESPATVNRRLATIKHFAGFCEENGLKNFARSAKGLTIAPNKPKSLPEQEFQRLVALAETLSLRDRVIFELLAFGGLRRFEVLGINLGQLDLAQEVIKSVRRKGNKYQNIPLRSEAVDLLARYVIERAQEYPSKPNSPLICTKHGEDFRMSDSRIYQIVKRWGRDLHPHKFRHTFATRLLALTNNDVSLVGRVLGHSDPKITMRYVERTDEQIKDGLNKL